MKKTQKQKQILFFNNNSLSLFVISFFQDKKYLCYSNSIEIDKRVDLKTQLIKLKTIAENYLDQIIDEIDLIIDNGNISKICCTNETYDNCKNENDLLLEITKNLQKENCFVNDVVLKEKSFSQNKATTSFEAYVLDSTIINHFFSICEQINLKVLSTNTILNMLATKDVVNEVIINFDSENRLQIIKYHHQKIYDIKNTSIKYDDFIAQLSIALSVNTDETKKILNIANSLMKKSTFNIDNICLSTHLNKTFDDMRKITISAFLDQIKNVFFTYISNQNIVFDFAQTKMAIFGTHQNIFNHLCKLINNYQNKYYFDIIGFNQVNLLKQICLNKIDNNYSQLQNTNPILKTSNIKNSMSIFKTNYEDYTIKG